MQLEWNRYIEGVIAFKENQGMLWLLCICLFAVLWYKKMLLKHELFLGSLILGGCVVCPISACLLMKVFTPFYSWLDLQQIFPTILLAAVFGTELFFFLKKRNIPGLSLRGFGKTIISAGVLIIILSVSTVFHGFDSKTAVQEQGIPVKTAEIFEGLQGIIGDSEIVLAAPNNMLEYTRLFCTDWHPVYGRDLWSAKSASYINSGYDWEYQYYDILSKDDLSEERAERFTALINEGKADCVIIPDFWLEYIGETPDYEKINVTDIYIGIIKKELIIK